MERFAFQCFEKLREQKKKGRILEDKALSIITALSKKEPLGVNVSPQGGIVRQFCEAPSSLLIAPCIVSLFCEINEFTLT